MKAIVLKNAHELVVEEAPEPQIGPDEALVKVAACGICGTDLHLYKHGSLSPNVRMGHESAGTIVEVGKQIEGFRIGDRVAILGRIPCGQCHWCRRGRHHICPTRLDVRGGFSEYVAAKEGMLARIPDNLTFKQAAVVEAMAVSLHGVRLAQIGKGDGVVVTGAGPIGLFAAALLRDIGVRKLVISEPSNRRRETASRWADRVVNPVEEDLAEIAREALDPCVDALVECSGQPRVLEDAFNIVGFAGRVLLLAACLENINVNPALLLVREIRFETSYGCDMEEFRHCIELVRSGRVDVDPIISRAVSQAELPEAFERLCGPNDDVKIVMDIP
ncbi:alcohol dehydrogenase catalytic domain-containing protein [Candidatus Poribacteria bacterium]|nr:alcohol dehydrogenase catalytic domain-containing protein [Candidatus Poribacteria bacterium]